MQKHALEMKCIVAMWRSEKNDPGYLRYLRGGEESDQGSCKPWFKDMLSMSTMRLTLSLSPTKTSRYGRLTLQHVGLYFSTERAKKKYLLHSRSTCALIVLYGVGHLIAWNLAFRLAAKILKLNGTILHVVVLFLGPLGHYRLTHCMNFHVCEGFRQPSRSGTMQIQIGE